MVKVTGSVMASSFSQSSSVTTSPVMASTAVIVHGASIGSKPQTDRSMVNAASTAGSGMRHSGGTSASVSESDSVPGASVSGPVSGNSVVELSPAVSAG